jgi:hypothetical protein
MISMHRCRDRALHSILVKLFENQTMRPQFISHVNFVANTVPEPERWILLVASDDHKESYFSPPAPFRMNRNESQV